MENSIRVGSAGRNYFGPKCYGEYIAVRWPQCVPPAQSYVGVKRDDESSDQATAKVCASQHARIVSRRMSAIRATTGWKEARAALEVDEIKRKSK